MNEKQILNFQMEVYKKWNDAIVIKAFNEGIQMGIELLINENYRGNKLIIHNLRDKKKKDYGNHVPSKYRALCDSMEVLGILTGSEASSYISGFGGFKLRGEPVNTNSLRFFSEWYIDSQSSHVGMGSSHNLSLDFGYAPFQSYQHYSPTHMMPNLMHEPNLMHDPNLMQEHIFSVLKTRNKRLTSSPLIAPTFEGLAIGELANLSGIPESIYHSDPWMIDSEFFFCFDVESMFEKVIKRYKEKSRNRNEIDYSEFIKCPKIIYKKQ